MAYIQGMPERSSKGKARPKRPTDINQLAASVVRAATEGEDLADEFEGKNPAAVMLGRLGGKKGGRARADKLTAEQRSEIARRAAAARWSKR